LRQYRGDVRERLLRLCDECLGEAAVLVLTDHTADEHHFATRANQKVAAIKAERTHVVPLVLIFGLVIGAMTGGLATPTQAAARRPSACSCSR
jgi:TRAP-type C4-dicarboxylate transport system permease large subunit